jgi:RNase P/RNase MRP subunit p29
LQRFAANDIPDRAFDLASRGRPATAGVVEVGCGRDRGATSASTNASGTVLLVGHHTVVVHARARMMVGMCLSGNVVAATANLQRKATLNTGDNVKGERRTVLLPMPGSFVIPVPVAGYVSWVRPRPVPAPVLLSSVVWLGFVS